MSARTDILTTARACATAIDADAFDLAPPHEQRRILFQSQAVLRAMATLIETQDAHMTPSLRVAVEILDERRRQTQAEGASNEADDQYGNAQLARAAAAYALDTAACTYVDPKSRDWIAGSARALWPWDASTYNPKAARRNLVRAGALIIAEIERLDRAAVSNG